MKTQLLTLATVTGLALTGLATAAQASSTDVEIRHAVARVSVIPEAGRTQIAVEVINGSTDLPHLTVGHGLDGRIIVDGRLEHRVRGCTGFGHSDTADVNPASPSPNIKVRIRDHADVLLKDAPVVVVRTPMDVHVEAGDAVFGSVDRSASVHLGVSGCGDWTVANTQGDLHLAAAGSGDIHTGNGGDVKADIAGSGDIFLGAVRSIKADIAGSGDVKAASANGSVEVSIAGSGDVTVLGGHVDRVKASIAGSGDVKVNAAVNEVDASIMGSGDVKVKSAGQIHKSVMGSGSVIVGD